MSDISDALLRRVAAGAAENESGYDYSNGGVLALVREVQSQRQRISELEAQLATAEARGREKERQAVVDHLSAALQKLSVGSVSRRAVGVEMAAIQRGEHVREG